ncbi:MAG: SDR family oxidoreductase [Acidobacteriota bacterium]|nr:SDR family oxidoreductase [Acidobacteriota bacterium]
MRILVFGGNGMLGHKLVQVLQESFDVWATIRGTINDVENFGIFKKNRIIEGIEVQEQTTVRRAIKISQPDFIINAVGIIKQLPTSNDVIKTLTLNSIFPHQLAELTDEFGFRLISISTDCVFDGKKGNYIEEDAPNAPDLYGMSKHLGEVLTDNCLTLRTSIIGRELGTAHSLVEWFLSNEGKKVDGFFNAIYSGFPTIVLADIIKDLIVKHPKLNGLYHVSSEPISKYGLLGLLKTHYKLNIEIERFEDFRIDRSLNSTKFRTATGFSPTDWDDMIGKMAADPTPYGKWKA